jgi:hypothetical protein
MEQRRRELVEQAAAYIMRPATSAAALDELQQHINEAPEWEPVNTALPADEVAERLEIISELEDYWKTNFKDLTDKTTMEEYYSSSEHI